ncbi:RNA polymerase sigma-70 factor [Sphingobacterium sp.]|uniref:RNA polymerase sigma factor n=1 Tax=Sphingobacterium sp. TaxID=341027 RepID=UPI0031D16D87
MLEKSIYGDHELILLLQDNDRMAINIIYDRYWKSLYLSAFAVLGDNEQAQDIVQDVLLQLWIRKDKVKIENLSAYLHTATRYKVLTYIRSAQNRKVILDETEFVRIGGIEDLNDNIHQKDINNLLQKEVLSLPERCRQVFVLSRTEFLTNSEIASKLGITVKAVESQITIALKKLRGKLSDLIIWLFILFSTII